MQKEENSLKSLHKSMFCKNHLLLGWSKTFTNAVVPLHIFRLYKLIAGLTHPSTKRLGEDGFQKENTFRDAFLCSNKSE